MFKVKKLVCSFLGVCLLASNIFPAHAISDVSNTASTDSFEKIYEQFKDELNISRETVDKTATCCDMFNGFMNDVSEDKFKSLSENVLSDELDEKSLNSVKDEKVLSQRKKKIVTKYPANYCGCYFDYDVDKLVVYVKDINDIGDIENYFDTDYVEYRKANNSLNELENIKANFSIDICDKFSIQSTYTDQEKNVFNINYVDSSCQNDMLEYIDMLGLNQDAIALNLAKKEEVVLTSSYYPTCSQTPNPGKRICEEFKVYYGYTGKGAGTITCHAYKNGVYGIVTCGHVVDGKDNMLLYNQSDPLSPKYQYLFNGSDASVKLNNNCDAAFIPLENQSQKSKYLWNKGTDEYHYYQYCPGGTNNQNVTMNMINGSSSYVYQGMAIVGYGSTSGYQVGTVTAIDFSDTYSSVNRSDSLKLSFPSVGGDSGGPIGYLHDSCYPGNGQKVFELIGIMTASYGDPSGNGLGGGPALCQRWSNVKSELGVSLYSYN